MPEQKNPELVKTEGKIIDAFTAINGSGQFLNPPKDDEQLHLFIDVALGFSVPRKRVVPHHRAPFEFIADLYFERVKNVLGFANRAGGKCLALDTPVLTTEGWSTMGDLQQGQFVYAPDGHPTEVLSVNEVKHGHDCFAVNIDDKETIVADADHLWEVVRVVKKDTRRMTTRELYEVYRNPPKIDHVAIFTIKIPEPLQHDEIELPIDPYVLGAWLGDGSRKASVIHNWDASIFAELQKRWPDIKDASTPREGRKEGKEGKFYLYGLLQASAPFGYGRR